MKQRIILSSNLEEDLAIALSECERDRIFVLTDATTRKLCWPIISRFIALKHAQVITILSSDESKNLDSLAYVWKALSDGGATRHSLLINLGGGMVTDLGGFAASTFKRGINFINIPTTLLSMVDASVGGKTGINFNGLKNEIGVFSDARFVLISPQFLQTLTVDNLFSGYAEMLKHGLLSSKADWAELVNFSFDPVDYSLLGQMVRKSIRVKERFVAEDPREQDIRKALNLGHTVGHALEAYSLSEQKSLRPLLHGYAVAYGLIAELYLSGVLEGFPTDTLRQTVTFIREHYGTVGITCDDYPRLIELMHHDKKNTGRDINFTLLADIGTLRLNQTATDEQIKEALDFLREG